MWAFKVSTLGPYGPLVVWFQQNLLSLTEDDPSPPRVPVPDTNELCKRLEEKIMSLTKIGGNLQKENKGTSI